MKKIHQHLKKTIYALFAILAVFSPFASVAYGAVLYFEPARIDIGIGDEFSVDVYIDTEGERVNAFETNIVFSDTHLAFTDIISNDSIIDFWIERGHETAGTLSLSGIKTNGFRSVVDPFGVTTTAAKIATLVFEGKATGSSLLVLAGSKVLLNDGLGTPTATSNGASVPVRVFSSIAGGNQETPETGEDTTKPEPFQVYVEKSTLLPRGGDYVFFQSTDRESDIEYYEVKVGNDDWKRAESPYLLQTNFCPLEVQVKAVDRYGNERIAVTYTECLDENNQEVFVILALLVFLVLLFFIFILMRKRRRREEEGQS